GLYTIAGCILQLGIRHFILSCVYQLHIADCSWCLLDLAGHTFIALATDASGPVYRGICAHLRLPFWTDFAQVVCPNVGRPAAIGAVDNHNLLIWQRDSWVQRRDLWVIPFLDSP